MSRTRMLLVHSIEDGPWVDVSRVGSIEVRGGDSSDIIEIKLVGSHNNGKPWSVMLKGPQHKQFLYPDGKMKVIRRAGKNPITVIAHTERIGKSARVHTIERHCLSEDSF